jgi:hypothetical protein
MAVGLAGALAVGLAKPGAVMTNQQPGSGVSAMESQGDPDQEIALLRQNLRTKKRQLIGQNLPLSDQEAEKFWPVYNHYAEELKQINAGQFGLIESHGERWATMSDQDALIYIRRWIEVGAKIQALRLK